MICPYCKDDFDSHDKDEELSNRFNVPVYACTKAPVHRLALIEAYQK